MENKKILEIIRNNNYGSSIIFNLKRENLYDAVFIITSFLEGIYDKILWSQRIWHIKNGIYQLIYCEICNINLAKFSKNGYYMTCSEKCSNMKKKKSYHNTCESKYGVDSYSKTDESKKKIRDAIKETFGVDNYSKTDEFRKFMKNFNPIRKVGVKQKIKETNIAKRGVDNPMKDNIIKEKVKNTCLKRYGVDNYSKTDESKIFMKEIGFGSDKFMRNMVKSIINKYGVDNYSKTDEFKEKVKNTCLKRYGVDNYSKTDEFKEKASYKIRKYLHEEAVKNIGEDYEILVFGINMELFHKKCNKSFIVASYFVSQRKIHNNEICVHCNPLYKNWSTGEKNLLKFIRDNYSSEIMSNYKRIIPPFELDIYIPDLRIGVEFNGDYYHANPRFYNKNYFNNKLKMKAEKIWEKDRKKRDICFKKNITLIIVWEHDWNNNQEKEKERILNLINNNK